MDMEVEDTNDIEVNPVGGKTLSQIAQDKRRDPATPNQADLFPGGPHCATSDSNTR